MKQLLPLLFLCLPLAAQVTGLTKEINTGSGVATPAHTAPEFAVFIVKEP